MKKNKTDRRVKYTKMVIKESLIKFLKQKHFSKITIKEICEDADVNRATFYKHYLDQYDLLHQIQKEVVDDITGYLRSYDKNSKEAPKEMIVNVLDYINENVELFDVLLNSDSTFYQDLINILNLQKLTTLVENSQLCKEDIEYIFHFYASGSLGVIQKWLKDKTKKSSEELAELIIQMSMEGRSSFNK
ncbi:TetR/AcrR family transcriptional regulator [Paenibacillus puldeungensis]|uniref:TetR/AcrR family transcriptional regulator n=1 Tax=Paenibacillus puldeungensis TaxID=696536 RepID=A0ABW3S5J4_9BACL